MVVYEKSEPGCTVKTITMAAERAAADGVHLVVASTTGATAWKAAVEAARLKILDKLVIVGSVQDRGKSKISDQTVKQLQEMGITVVRTSHVLSGAERGLSSKLGGVYPVEIMAHTLRMLSQGVKVCLECSVMALDCGAIPYGEAVVAVGGTGRGADTACVLTPAGANAILESRIHEILCKPY